MLGRADERSQLPEELPPHQVLLIALEPHLLLNVVDCLALARLGQLKCAFERCYAMVHETMRPFAESVLFSTVSVGFDGLVRMFGQIACFENEATTVAANRSHFTAVER